MNAGKLSLAWLIAIGLFLDSCATRQSQTSGLNKSIAPVTTNSTAPISLPLPITAPNPVITNQPAQRLTNTLFSSIVIPTNASPAYVSNLIATTRPSELYKAYEHGLIGKDVMMQAMLMAQNKKSLDLYGKVIDQNGDPVVGATVEGGILLNKDFVHSASEAHYTTTDSSGYFSFIGVHGVALGIRPRKDGYVFSSRVKSERPGDYHPDPNNPVVFTMWKLKGPEPMVHVKASSLVPCDGTLTQFDLLTGKKSATGDLKVQLKRDPVNIIRGKPFNWSATLEIPSGGLQPMEDPYPNEAPIEGYLPSISLNFPTNMVHWNNSLYKQFYFKSRNGEIYGRMTVLIQADFQPPPTYFSADIYANPAGSRNLEWDTKQAVLPH